MKQINLNIKNKNYIYAIIGVVIITILSLWVFNSNYFFGDITRVIQKDSVKYQFSDSGASGSYFYSENFGWIISRFSDDLDNYSLYLVESIGSGAYLSGFAWADNIGWMIFGSGSGPFDSNGRWYPIPQNQSAQNFGVNAIQSNGDISVVFSGQTITKQVKYKLEGYVYFETIGYVNFSGVYITDDYKFLGYAYSPTNGFIYLGPISGQTDFPTITPIDSKTLKKIEYTTKQNVVITQVGNSLKINWDILKDPITDTNISGIRYMLYRNVSDNLSNANIIFSGSNVNEYVDTNLVPNIPYYYWVVYEDENGRKIDVAFGSSSSGEQPKILVDSIYVKGTCWDNKVPYTGPCDQITVYMSGSSLNGFRFYSGSNSITPILDVNIAELSTHSGSFTYNSTSFNYMFSNISGNSYKITIKNSSDSNIPVGDYRFYVTGYVDNGESDKNSGFVSIYSPDPNNESYIITYGDGVDINNKITLGSNLIIKLNGVKRDDFENTIQFKYGPDGEKTNYNSLWDNVNYDKNYDTIEGAYKFIVNSNNIISSLLPTIKNDSNFNGETNTGIWLSYYFYSTGYFILPSASLLQDSERFHIGTINDQPITVSGYYIIPDIQEINGNLQETVLAGQKALKLEWNAIPGIAGNGAYIIKINTGAGFLDVANSGLQMKNKDNEDISFGDTTTGVYLVGLQNKTNYQVKLIAKITRTLPGNITDNLFYKEKVFNYNNTGIDMELVVVRMGTGGLFSNTWGNDVLLDDSRKNNLGLNFLGGNVYGIDRLDGGYNVIQINPSVDIVNAGYGKYTFNIDTSQEYTVNITASGYVLWDGSIKDGKLTISNSGAGIIYKSDDTNNKYVIGMNLRGDVASPSDLVKYANGQCNASSPCIGNPDGLVDRNNDAYWLWYATSQDMGVYYYISGAYRFYNNNILPADVASPSDLVKYANGQCNASSPCIGNPDGLVDRNNDAYWLWYATSQDMGVYYYISGAYRLK